jgi:DNA repair exonuclease SbcCD ATPase subunit
MRTTLSIIVMLLLAPALKAQKSPGDEPKPSLVPELRKQLASLQDRLGQAEQARNDEDTDYKVKLASLEADHKTKIAKLEQEVRRVSAAIEQVQRHVGQLEAEEHRQADAARRSALANQRTKTLEMAPPGEKTTSKPPGVAPTEKKIETPSDDAQPVKTVDQKLDAVLGKLEEMDRRIRQLETRSRNQR